MAEHASREALLAQRSHFGELRDERDRLLKRIGTGAVKAEDSLRAALKVGRVRAAVQNSIDRRTAKQNYTDDLLNGKEKAHEAYEYAMLYLSELSRERKLVLEMLSLAQGGNLTSSETKPHLKRFRKLEAERTNDAALKNALEPRVFVEEKEVEPVERYGYDESDKFFIFGPDGKRHCIADSFTVSMLLYLDEHATADKPVPAHEMWKYFLPSEGVGRSDRKFLDQDLRDRLVEPLISVDAKLKSPANGKKSERGFYIQWHKNTIPPGRKLVARPFGSAVEELYSQFLGSEAAPNGTISQFLEAVSKLSPETVCLVVAADDLPQQTE